MMGFERAQKIADTVLLEGYVLYPYRASSKKNRYRWTFGVLAPRAWSEAGGCEPWWLEACCLVRGKGAIAGRLRFLRVVERIVEHAAGDMYRVVPELEVDGTVHVTFEEGEIREIDFEIPAVASSPVRIPFSIPYDQHIEPLRNAAGTKLGQVVHVKHALTGTIRAAVEDVGDLRRVIVRVENDTPFERLDAPRTDAAHSSFCSSHLLLQSRDGRFVSLTDPPDDAREAAAGCINVGTNPVLCGDHTMLCSPIILYDDPQIAPESPGDFCDATEIDEILTLRTMTLTEEEKKLACATSPRAAAIIGRVDSLPSEAMARLHGAFRDRPAAAAEPMGIRPGARVRLRLGARRREVGAEGEADGAKQTLTDAQDLLYVGRAAVIEEIKQDIDGRECFAVTFEGDPAAELHRWYGRYHYFYADEVELLAEGEPA